jgi:hypothetical protein
VNRGQQKLRSRALPGGKVTAQLPTNMRQIIGGKRYSTKDATVLASDAYWDGHNWERHGRNTYLCRTPRGNYFAVHLTRWQGELDRIEALTTDQAQQLYEDLPEHEVEFEEAFPGAPLEDA